MKYVISYSFADKVNLACCIIAKIEKERLFLVDSLTSKCDEDIVKKIEEYDKYYFSLDSIAKRRNEAMNMR